MTKRRRGHKRVHINARHKRRYGLSSLPFLRDWKISAAITYNDCPLMEEYTVFGFRLLIFLIEYIKLILCMLQYVVIVAGGQN